MCEIQQMDNMEQLYEVVRPFSVGLACALKNFFCGPSDRELYLKIKVYAMNLNHLEKIKILECIIELAKINQLSDEKFRVLMTAFSE